MTFINIIAVALSPAVAVIIGYWLTKRRETRQQKFYILYALMTTRINRLNAQYVDAVNCIDLFFANNKKVRQAWKELKNLYGREDSTYEEANNLNMRLIEEIAISLGYKDKITWQDITMPYVPKWLNEEWKNSSKFKDMQLQFGNFISAFSSAPEQADKRETDKEKI